MYIIYGPAVHIYIEAFISIYMYNFMYKRTWYTIYMCSYCTPYNETIFTVSILRVLLGMHTVPNKVFRSWQPPTVALTAVLSHGNVKDV